MLSATTEHAVRALVHLARLPHGTSTLGRDLAESADIPSNYLAKILLALRNAGYLETSRGLGGGYRLARTADQIRLIDVVELFEGIRSRPGCFLGEKHDCSDQQACSAHASWKAVRQAYIGFLESNSIADVSAVHSCGSRRTSVSKKSKSKTLGARGSVA
jgi:Rrf2 family protein